MLSTPLVWNDDKNRVPVIEAPEGQYVLWFSVDEGLELGEGGQLTQVRPGVVYYELADIPPAPEPLPEEGGP